MDRGEREELFEQSRREYEFGVGSIKGVSDRLGVHRRTVRQALESAVPSGRQCPARACPVLGPLKRHLDAILEAGKRAPRKQRHAAHRIWVRLRQEHPEHPVAEATARQYARERKLAIGLLGRDIWIPQVHDWGQEALVDWYAAYADLGAARTNVQVLVMRSMKSCAAFHRAYPRATQQAFLEAHAEAFAYFGGVFGVLRYDNLRSAVKNVLRGHTRDEHTRFIALRSHWQFTAEFCSPSEPQEKGAGRTSRSVRRRARPGMR